MIKPVCILLSLLGILLVHKSNADEICYFLNSVNSWVDRPIKTDFSEENLQNHVEDFGVIDQKILSNDSCVKGDLQKFYEKKLSYKIDIVDGLPQIHFKNESIGEMTGSCSPYAVSHLFELKSLDYRVFIFKGDYEGCDFIGASGSSEVDGYLNRFKHSPFLVISSITSTVMGVGLIDNESKEVYRFEGLKGTKEKLLTTINITTGVLDEVGFIQYKGKTYFVQWRKTFLQNLLILRMSEKTILIKDVKSNTIKVISRNI